MAYLFGGSEIRAEVNFIEEYGLLAILVILLIIMTTKLIGLINVCRTNIYVLRYVSLDSPRDKETSGAKIL